MASQSDVTKLAEKIVEVDAAAEEYRQMATDIRTDGPAASWAEWQNLKVYEQEVTNLTGISAGLWAAAEVLGKSDEVTAKVIELKEGPVLKLTNTSVLQHLSRK